MTDDADPQAVAEATTSFLADRDDGEQALEAVLEVEAASETWTFDDVALDSGTFGELVSRGVVEKVDSEYRVADVETVRVVLDGEEVTSTGATDRGFALEYDVDLRALSALVGALVVVAGARMLSYGSVFQRGYVVSPGNDPYYFRYWLEDRLAESSGLTD
ncbi:dolichyl-diphosphooligosaccharide--protein glycosyltransferase [Halobiforma haloterrestris]|uniref:Dolichyl-diphosphooligosaccharide--protein glycosyltransferase n=1 Tax=Natronobacterium haloterrestre TaxID=148448 RepID=A0A1I1KP19_NATHA|nr:dolichyl-diphosphooligosaccharide--protein glycosyltransferase [Halobiforma haloterrestris]